MASIVPAPNNFLEHRVAALEQQIREMQRGTLYSAAISDGGLDIQGTGGITVRDPEGNETFFVGGRTGSFARPDGSPQPVFVASDDDGHWRIAVFDADPAEGGYHQAVWTWDHEGRVAFSTDRNGGIAEPWICVPLTQTFHDSVFADSLNTFQTLPASAATGGVAWEGRIGKVSHPWLQIDGVWGRVTGNGAVPTYTMSIDNRTLGSWTQVGFGSSRQGPWDISDFLTRTDVPVRLNVSATGTGTDRVVCHVFGTWMRQT